MILLSCPSLLAQNVDTELLKTYIIEEDTLGIEQITCGNPEIFNTPVEQNQTALSFAIVNGYGFSAYYMLTHGADLYAANPEGKNSIQMFMDNVTRFFDGFLDMTADERGVSYWQIWTGFNVIFYCLPPDARDEFGENYLNLIDKYKDLPGDLKINCY